MEVWKPVVDYPEYEVSNTGRVRKNGKLKKIYDTCGGYKSGIKGKHVHTLVLPAFRPNTAPWLYDKIEHIDGNGRNNNLVNLRWSNTTLINLNRRTTRGYDKINMEYRARITVKGKQILLGTYKSAEEAHAAYLEAKQEYHEMFDYFGIFQPK